MIHCRFETVTHPILVCGVSWLALLVGGCAPTSQAKSTEHAERPAATEAGAESNRRIFEGCDPVEEARRYEGLVGESVLITFAWTSTKGAAADLKAPATVIRIDSPYVTVAFDPRVPNLDLYASVWTYSGHIKGQSDGTFRVAPCSATIEKGGW